MKKVHVSVHVHVSSDMRYELCDSIFGFGLLLTTTLLPIHLLPSRKQGSAVNDVVSTIIIVSNN